MFLIAREGGREVLWLSAGENLCATSSTFAGRRHMIGKVVTGCVAILPYHTATQDRGSECRDFGFISRIVTALTFILEYFHCHHIETIVDVTMVIKRHACFYLWLLCSARNTKVRLWSLCKNHDNVWYVKSFSDLFKAQYTDCIDALTLCCTV